MKLWNKEESTYKKVESFTVGKDREYDKVLAQYDCEASIAHAMMSVSYTHLTLPTTPYV